jgi:hypothetical protein
LLARRLTEETNSQLDLQTQFSTQAISPPRLNLEELQMQNFIREVFPHANIRQIVNLRISEMKIYQQSKNSQITTMSQYIKMLRLRKRQFEKQKKISG